MDPSLDPNAPTRYEPTRGRSGRIPFNSARLGRPFPNTRRTPNPAFRDWGRSARQGPSRRRRGSRRYGTPPAAAHRRCNPAHRDERKLRLSAAGAPARHQGSAPSTGGPSASYRASRRRRRGSSSRRCMCRTEPAPHLRAPRPPGSPAECGPLSAWPRPSLSVSSHREHLGSQAGSSVWALPAAAERYVFGRPDILSSSSGSHSGTVASLAVIFGPIPSPPSLALAVSSQVRGPSGIQFGKRPVRGRRCRVTRLGGRGTGVRR
jgi:hypothetical protein